MTTATTQQQLEHHFEQVKQHPFLAPLYTPGQTYQQAQPIDKAQLATLIEQNFDLRQESRGVYLVRSGGSTQAPLVFPVDIQENHAQRAVLAQAFQDHGIITSGDVVLNLFSYFNMYRTAAIYDDLCERCDATTLAMNAGTPNPRVYDIARQYQPQVLLGYPSRLARCAEYLKQAGMSMDIPRLKFGGEFLLPSQQALFAEVFNTKAIFSTYGAAEVGIFAWSRHSETPSLFHVLPGILVEIHQPNDQGYGDILVTNLYRQRFPLFRYSLGDVGRWVNDHGQPLLELAARHDKSFYLDSNNYALSDFAVITQGAEAFQLQLQIIDNARIMLTFLIVRDLPKAQHSSWLDTATQQIKQIIEFDPKMMQLELRLVAHKDLYMDPETQKVPQILDLRQ